MRGPGVVGRAAGGERSNLAGISLFRAGSLHNDGTCEWPQGQEFAFWQQNMHPSGSMMMEEKHLSRVAQPH